MLTKLIDKFKIKYLSGSSPKSILLKDNIGNIGTLVFHHDAASLPIAREIQGFIILNFYLRDFNNVLYMLNHQQPVYLHYAGTGKEDENGIITGEDEPGWLRAQEIKPTPEKKKPKKQG